MDVIGIKLLLDNLFNFGGLRVFLHGRPSCFKDLAFQRSRIPTLCQCAPSLFLFRVRCGIRAK